MARNNSHASGGLSLCASGLSPEKLRLLDDYVRPGKVLDVGCGNGMYGVHLESKGCDVLQIDMTDRRDARARYLPFRIMDAQRLDFAADEFDHVIAFDVMEHLDDDIKFLQDVRRVCKGHFFLSVPNSDDEQIVNYGMTHVHHKDKTHRREYTAEQLNNMLVDNGFKPLSIRPNYTSGLPLIARALARDCLLSKVAAELIVLQCKALMKVGLFENRTVGDWYCVAEKLSD